MSRVMVLFFFQTETLCERQTYLKMDIKEAERVVIAKPVASRPTCSTFKSFSELLAGAINVSPDISSSQATVSAIRPKTVRFKPAALNHPHAGFDSCQVNFCFTWKNSLLPSCFQHKWCLTISG